MDLATAAARFAPEPGYLDTATVGVPCADAVAAMTADLDRWRRGVLRPFAYDEVVHAARRAFGRLVGVTADRVGIVAQLSVATAVATTALGPGDEVVVAREDFTSVLFPFLQARERGVEVTVVPLAGILDAVTDRTAMVAVSAVQSADGRVLDLDALADVADARGCLTYVDLTQAAGWLPVDAGRFSLTGTAAYKWLCSPRGTGFVTVRADVADRFTPVAAGWYAGAEVWDAIYGPPLRLATDGRRFDTSPAWNAWVGATPTLELLAAVGAAAIGRHDVGLADAMRARLDLPPSDSAVVSVGTDGALEALRAAGVRCAGRDGRARLAFHLYSTEADVDLAARALGR
jgi:selenocysteine lyase/cysteine desulfurase